MARRRGFTQTVRVRKSRDWGLGPGSEDGTAITATGSTLIGAGVAPLGAQELTVARIRGLLTANIFSTAANGDGFFGAFGIGKVPVTAFAAGIGSVPTPITEIDWDGWLYHTFIDVRRGAASLTNGMGFQRVEIDSKAMRKLDSQEVIYGVLEVKEVGTVEMRVFFNTRALFLLA